MYYLEDIMMLMIHNTAIIWIVTLSNHCFYLLCLSKTKIKACSCLHQAHSTGQPLCCNDLAWNTEIHLNKQYESMLNISICTHYTMFHLIHQENQTGQAVARCLAHICLLTVRLRKLKKTWWTSPYLQKTCVCITQNPEQMLVTCWLRDVTYCFQLLNTTDKPSWQSTPGLWNDQQYHSIHHHSKHNA